MRKTSIDDRTGEKPRRLFNDQYRWHGMAVALMMLLGITLYGHTVDVPFYLDDIANVRDNLLPLTSFSLSDLVDTAFGGLLRWRPLSNLSFAIQSHFHGFQVRGYHVVNVLIHLANGILLYGFLFKTLTLADRSPNSRHRAIGIGLAGSLVWFVHPVQIQAVTYIVQRMTSMATLFSLVSMLTYLYGRQAIKPWTRATLVCICALSWCLAVASKEIALTLPALIFMYEWFFFQDLDGRFIKKWGIPVLALMGGLLFLIHRFYGYSPLTFLTVVEQPRGFTAFERLLTETRVVFLYMALLLYPHPSRLTLNHDIAISRGITDPITTLLSCLGLLGVAVCTVLIAKKNRLSAFCIIWFFTNLALEGLAASIEPMFEHRLYLPSMLVFLPLMTAAFQTMRKPSILAPALAVWILVLSCWTYQRNAVWKDPVLFWKDAVAKTPNHYRTHFQLGLIYLTAGNLDTALSALQQSLALTPPYPTEIYTNIGIAYFKKGNIALAREHLDKALALNANNYIALDLLGTLNREQGNLHKAMALYREAVTRNPAFMQSHHNLGLLYLEMGSTADAIKTFEKMITTWPMSSPGYSGLGLALAKQGRLELAVAQFKEALKRNAQDRDAVFNLGITYTLTEQYAQAAAVYESVLGLDPNDVETLHNLGILYLKHLGDIQRARECFHQALAADPHYNQAAVARQILNQEM